MAEPLIFTAEQWGAQAPRTSHFPTRLAEGIVVHNTQGPNRAALAGDAEEQEAFEVARQIQRDHFGRGFSDTGQHFTISRGGLLLEGRHGSLGAAHSGRVVQGAHAQSEGNRYNKRFFGIEVEGDNRAESGGDQVLPAQFEALVELCSWLSFWGHFDSQRILPHLEVLAGHTDCPGLFAARVPELIGRVHTRKLEILNRHG